MKSPIDLIFANSRVSSAFILFLLLAGMLAYINMPRAKDGAVIMRTAVLTTKFAGATPSRIESLVTVPLERAIRQMPEVRMIRSESKNSFSNIFVSIKVEYSDMDKVWQKLRKKINFVQLPKEASKPYLGDEFTETYGTLVTLVGEGFSYAELEKVASEVKEEFLTLKDVGKVDLLGLQQERIYVEFSNAKLAEVGLSPAELGEIIRKRNIITPGGAITIGPQRLILEPTGNIKSIEELGKTIIPIPAKNSVVFLEDIANIRSGYSEPRDPMVRYQKEQSIVIAVSLNASSNILDLGRELKAKIKTLKTLYPIGIEFDFAFNEAEIVEEIIDNFMSSLLQAILIVIGVMFLTLGWRVGFVVATLIPASMLTALFFMERLDIGLNQVSLAALIISLGLLVDNAIVMTEAITVRLDEGFKSIDAAKASVSELSVSLLTSSLTTAAAFLPIYLAESAASEYISSLFIVVSIVLLTSWVYSITLTPVLSILLLKKSKVDFSYNNPLCNAFKNYLVFSLRYRYASLLMVVVVAVVGFSLFRYVPQIFFPPADAPSITLKIELPLGTHIDRTLEITQKVEEFLDKRRPEFVHDYTSFVGKGSPRYWINNTPKGEASNYAEILVNMNSLDTFDVFANDLDKFALESFSDALISIQKLVNGPPASYPFELLITGKDIGAITERAREVKEKLHTLAGVREIGDDWGIWSQKLVVEINPSLAYHAGVSYSNIANSLQTALSGQGITQLRREDKSIPIVLRSSHSQRDDLDTLESTLVFVPAKGTSVPLTQVADIDIMWEPPKIMRYNGQHTITVRCKTEGTTAFDIMNQVNPWLETLDWKAGYRYEYGGEIKNSRIAEESISKKLPIAAMIIILLLIVQFNSVRRTFIILITIPLGIVGVVLGLLVTKSYFGFMTYLGVISLTGIVINNAIILIERIELEIKETGMSPQDAIIEAAQRRMRPITLTTMTTVGGLLPLWLGGGGMWEPMAIAIIFGLAFATVLTLGVVPLFYSLIFNVKYPKDYIFSCIVAPKAKT